MKTTPLSPIVMPVHRLNVVKNPRLPEKLPEKLGERRRLIIDRIRATPRATIFELMAELGISHTAVKNNISWLKKHGYIRRVGPDKGGYWEVVQGGGK